MSNVTAEQCVVDGLLKAASAKVLSAQDLARERRSLGPDADGAMEPRAPLPPPSLPPDDGDCDTGVEDNECSAKPSSSKPKQTKALSKNITIFKNHVKVTVAGEHRKFEQKEWGLMTEGVPLLAAGTFEHETFKMLALFDSTARNPEERKGILMSAGCDPKVCAKGKTIASQRDALIRQLLQGKVDTVERKVFARLLQQGLGDRDLSVYSIVAVSGEFIASYSDGKKKLEMTFPKIHRAIRWLQSIGTADKERGFVL